MAIDESKFPELAKMEGVSAESQAIGNFIEWLGENGMAICQTEDGLRGPRFFPVMEQVEQLLARHFGIDLVKVELERRAVFAACRGAASQDEGGVSSAT